MIIRSLLPAATATLLNAIPTCAARTCLRRGVPRTASNDAVRRTRQILVDVSVIINGDARTGIQRVVRALLVQLLAHPPAGCHVRPVFATKRCGYRYAPDNFVPGSHDVCERGEPQAVKVNAGDVFLGLDLAAHLLPRHHAELIEWRRAGASVHIVVYDLLPLMHPEWFRRRTTKNFKRWLRTIALFADSVVCISDTVKNDVEQWLSGQYGISKGTIPVATIPMGADIDATMPSHGIPNDINELLTKVISKPTVLMVGTLEPRKGHSRVIAAFDLLWRQGHDVNLIIIGKPGWKTVALQNMLLNHLQNGRHLVWIDNASDDLLQLMYKASAGIVIASEAEGFGLPLIEAQYHGKRVLARDIPVFHEIGNNCTSFFEQDDAESLASTIIEWLRQPQPLMHSMPVPTWHHCAQHLLALLGFGSCQQKIELINIFEPHAQEVLT